MKRFVVVIILVFQVFVYYSQATGIYQTKLSRNGIQTNIESYDLFTFFDEVSGQIEIKEASLLHLKSKVKELHRFINFTDGYKYSVYYHFNTDNQLIKYIYSQKYNDFQNNKILDSTIIEIEYFKNNKVKSRYVNSIKKNEDSVLQSQQNHYYYNINTGVIEKIINKSINCELNFQSTKNQDIISLKKVKNINCICNNDFPEENLMFAFDSLNNLTEIKGDYSSVVQYEYFSCEKNQLLKSINSFLMNNPSGNHQKINIIYDSTCSYNGYNSESRFIDQSGTYNSNTEIKKPNMIIEYNEFKDVIQLIYKINENEIIEKRKIKYF
jgi:hypothetical protein